MKKVEALISSLHRLGFVSLAQEISEKVLQEQLTEEIIPPQFSWIEKIGIKYKDMDSLYLFIQINWKQLEEINSFAKGKFKYIGGGYEGSAFQIGDGGMVLKMQEDYHYHPKPFEQGEEELEQLFGGNASPNQIMIYAHGELALPPDGEEYFSSGKRYWRIMEKVDVEDWQKDFNNELQNNIDLQILSLADELEPENIEESEGDGQDSGKEFDHYTLLRRQANRLGASNHEERKLLSKQIAEKVKRSKPSTVAKIKTIQKGLPDDWLENYIETFLFELCVKGKVDFASGNFGRRSNTGKFIWFDS